MLSIAKYYYCFKMYMQNVLLYYTYCTLLISVSFILSGNYSSYLFILFIVFNIFELIDNKEEL